MKTFKDCLLTMMISLVTSLGVYQVMGISEAHNVVAHNVQTEVHQYNENHVDSFRLMAHPEELDITIVADPAVCGHDQPLKVDITNKSRKGLTLDKTEFYISSVRNDSPTPLESVHQKYQARDLNLAPDEHTTQCFALPYEVTKDIEYGNDDSTEFNYRYFALPTAVSYTLDDDVVMK